MLTETLTSVVVSRTVGPGTDTSSVVVISFVVVTSLVTSFVTSFVSVIFVVISFVGPGVSVVTVM